MSWLVSLVVMSALGSALVVKIFSVLFGGILGPLAGMAKDGLFVGTWTAITVGLGIRDAKKAAHKLRPGQKEVGTHIEHPLKRKRLQ